MAHNRTVTINTSSETIEKLVFSLLFYLNITEERVLEDSDYPVTNEHIDTFARAKEFVYGLNYLFTASTETEEEDQEYDYATFVTEETDKLGRTE